MTKILVVDDTPLVRTWARVMLSDYFCCHIDEARDGVEAMEMLLKCEYSLVLMDIDMPRMNGFECTSKLREQERVTGSRIPVICMTTAKLGDVQNDCIEAGMDDCFSKDCTDQQFQDVIRRWLSL